MTLDQDFEKAAEDARNLTKRPSDAELLELYALYKQASVGDVKFERPGVFDFEARAKWDRWESKKGISKDKAKQSYIAYVTGLLTAYK